MFVSANKFYYNVARPGIFRFSSGKINEAQISLRRRVAAKEARHTWRQTTFPVGFATVSVLWLIRQSQGASCGQSYIEELAAERNSVIPGSSHQFAMNRFAMKGGHDETEKTIQKRTATRIL